MDEDFSEKIEKLKDMLGDEKVTDKFKDMISMFSNSQSNDGLGSILQNNFAGGIDTEKLALISKFKNIMDKKNHINDPRVNLLNAIKPYLNSQRQVRVDSFIKILSYTLLSNILKEENF